MSPTASQPPGNQAQSAEPVGIAILGSTGSIGTQALDVVRAHPGRFRVVSLAAGHNGALLRRQVREFSPQIVVAHQQTLDSQPFDASITCHTGPQGLVEAATHPDVDIVIVATSGHAAILPTYRAIEAGKTIALANKEAIVCAGDFIVPLARERGVELRPVDSEHSAIWQCMNGARHSSVARLILTASGGPFRDATPAELASVTVEQALAHPTWQMGGKVTIDSATMMNKGLEIIEAHWLFDIPYAQIDVLIHPESIVHSLVEFQDGSQIAQLSLPDMRLPIQYALTYPDRVPGPMQRLDLASTGQLSFSPVSADTFPGLALARRAGELGRSYPAVLSAADEIAVAAFLAGRIRFLDIVAVVEATLEAHQPVTLETLEDLSAVDAWARNEARSQVRARNLRAPA